MLYFESIPMIYSYFLFDNKRVVGMYYKKKKKLYLQGKTVEMRDPSTNRWTSASPRVSYTRQVHVHRIFVL